LPLAAFSRASLIASVRQRCDSSLSAWIAAIGLIVAPMPSAMQCISSGSE